MNTNPLPLLFSIASVAVAISSPAFAQPAHAPHGYSSEPPDLICVTLFSGDNYQGESITLAANENWDDLNDLRFPGGRRLNNRVSSILIEGPALVTLFDYRDFDGESISLLESVPRLDRIRQERWGNWDNDVSSIMVEVLHDDSGPVIGGPLRTSVPFGRTTTIPSYPHGRHVDEPLRDLGDDNYEKHIVLDRDTVRMVERAYNEVLGRSPDASGRSTYARVVRERGWDESRLRKELRKSPEFQQEIVPRTIQKAYRDLLGRDVDPNGLRTYTSRMIKSGWSEGRIRDSLKKSAEYASRTRRPVTPSTPRPDRPKPSVVAKPDRPKATVVARPDRPKAAAPRKETVRAKEPTQTRRAPVVTRSSPPRTSPVKESRPPPAKERTTSSKPPPPKLH
ncbi:hypothetical protein N9B49_00265 [bacterium]|nr:hypothetical protein [bacterium]